MASKNEKFAFIVFDYSTEHVTNSLLKVMVFVCSPSGLSQNFEAGPAVVS
jgi:hypothetical protein